MIVTFKNIPIASGGTPQPLVSTTLSAAVAPSASPQSVAVATSAYFKVGDEVFVGTTTTSERVSVLAIVDGTHFTGIFTKAHNSGVYVALSLQAFHIYVQPEDGGSGPVYIFYYPNAYEPAQTYGRGSLTPAITNRVLCVEELQKVSAAAQANDFVWSHAFGANPENLAFFWVDGTTSDNYLVAAGVT